MERSSSGTKRPFFKSISPSNSSSNNIPVQPEVLQALNAKVLKIQKSCQNLVKICIPSMQEERSTQKNSPTKMEILNISPADFNKVTPRITVKSKNLPSPLITPRSDFPSSKIDLKIENRSPAILKQGKLSSSPMKKNKKTSSHYPMMDSFHTDLNKSNIEKLKVRKLFKISKDFLKNILKLCNTCPDTSKISSLVAESCECFKKSLENIEKEEKIVSFYDEHPDKSGSYSGHAMKNVEYQLSRKIEEIEILRVKNEELECEIMKTKHMILMFSEERSIKENDLLVHVMKRLNRFSQHLCSVVKKMKEKFEFKAKNSSDEDTQTNSPKSAKINSLEYLLSESKLKIFELETSLKKMNSYKNEHFSLVSELAKNSEALETLRKTFKLKEIECKQKDLLIEKISEENKRVTNEKNSLFNEISENQEFIRKLKEDTEKNEFYKNKFKVNHKNLEVENKKLLEKLEISEEKIKGLEKSSKKKNTENLVFELEQVKLEKNKLEESLQDFYKVLKEKLALEEKLQGFEEILNEKQELEEKVRVLDDEVQVSRETIESLELLEKEKRLKSKENNSERTCECSKDLKVLKQENQQLKDKYLKVLIENENNFKTIKNLEKNELDSSNANFEISSLKHQLSLKTSELSSMRKSLQADPSNHLSPSREKTSFLEQSLSKLKILEQENITLMQETSEKSSKISSLESKLKDFESLPSSIKNEMISTDTIKSELLSLKSDLFNSTESCENLTKTLKSLESKLFDIEQAELKMIKMLEILKSTNETLSEENNSLIHSKSLLLSKNNELESDIKSLTERLFKKSHEISSLEDRIFSLSSGDKVAFSVNFDEMNRTKQALDETRSKLEETQKDLALTGVKLTFLTDQLNQLKSQNEGLREKNQKLERLLREKSSERKKTQSKTVFYADETFERDTLKLRSSTMIPDRKSILKKPSSEDQEIPEIFLENNEKVESFFTEDSPMKSGRIPFKGK
jgi:chromosome segregation ATPase